MNSGVHHPHHFLENYGTLEIYMVINLFQKLCMYKIMYKLFFSHSSLQRLVEVSSLTLFFWYAVMLANQNTEF